MVFFIPKHRIDRHSVHLYAREVILKLQSGHCVINERAINRRAINEYMERLYPMMYGNVIEIYNNDRI